MINPKINSKKSILITLKEMALITLVIFMLNNGFVKAQSISEVKVKMLSVEDLWNRINNQTDTIYLVNFWASWCKPCVEELPLIENIDPFFKGNSVKVLLVSLDFSNQIESHLKPFIKKHFIMNEVLFLTNDDLNSDLLKINSEWSGTIPACLFKYKSNSYFYEGQVDPGIIHENLTSVLQEN